MLPPSPFKAYLRQSSAATASEWPGRSNLGAVEGSSDNTSELKQFLTALTHQRGITNSGTLTVLPPPSVNAFVLAISSSRTGLSSKSALGDSTELAFPFGGEMDLISEDHARSDSAAPTTATATTGAVAKDELDSAQKSTNIQNRTSADPSISPQVIERNYVAGSQTNELAVAPQIESFVRHVEAFSLSVAASSIDPSQVEDSSQQLSRQLSEFRQFRANMN